MYARPPPQPHRPRPRWAPRPARHPGPRRDRRADLQLKLPTVPAPPSEPDPRR